ncbi:hypothetical protein [Microbacterium sp. zg-YB36]|uniref:hypothetical protein n=1 Tax=Microbacterium sp. zg-YB36 TaxID=2969407 RepID=UPI00214CFC50|nr:hypothetical protein [Microbacterium sp. zg-YB36]MDL5351149.1 hypothetical protein [Microbacterium sp. zg-YB36]
MTMKTPQQIAAEVADLPRIGTYRNSQNINGDGFRRAIAVAAIEADRAQLREALASAGPVPGIRPYRLATVDELLQAWDEYRGDETAFVDAWNAYTAGEDFPCPEAFGGVHEVTDGSCDACGDKNRAA